MEVFFSALGGQMNKDGFQEYRAPRSKGPHFLLMLKSTTARADKNEQDFKNGRRRKDP